MNTPTIVRRVCPQHGPWPDAVPRVLQRVYAARGVLTPRDAELKLAHLLAPDSLGGLEAAALLLADAIGRDRHIVVVGDFDCDGATGTAVAVRGLRLLGARRVGYCVPHRMVHGYGLSPALVASMAPMAPDLLLTVDNGIACLAGVAAAKARGWQVVVTDHHLPGPRLPIADAIVNPNLDGDAFPSKALAGVGVMFYLLAAVRRLLRVRDPALQADLSSLLDLVAVGTVADLVPLDYNNRLLVAAGLKRLRSGHAQPGLLALASVAGRERHKLTAADIGFAIGPRLNAAGRLEDMSLGIECLLSDDPERARDLAIALDRINGERRDLQQQMTDDAEALIAAIPLSPGAIQASVCLFDASWHPGVIGLVASRLKDRLHRPVVAFAPAEEGSRQLRGSARSIPGFHIRDALAAVDARHPGLIERFGGHAMAAGLTLDLDALPVFEQALADYAAASLDAALLRQELASDGALDAPDFCRELAHALRLAGPWGQGFPEPVFDNVFEVVAARAVGERHLKLELRVQGRLAPIGAIQFGGWTGERPPPWVRVAYQLDLDDFRGRDDVQLIIRHLQPA